MLTMWRPPGIILKDETHYGLTKKILLLAKVLMSAEKDLSQE